MIGITMGDANGVGPEIVLRAYHENRIPDKFIVIGDIAVLEMCRQHLSVNIQIRKIEDTGELISGFINVLDIGVLSADDLTIGSISHKTGQAALQYVKKAVELAVKRQIQAIVTLPINKEAVRLSTPDFQGHTDYIAQLCHVQNYTMMLVSDKLIVTHASMHVSLKEAINMVHKERIYDLIRLTHDAVRKLRPRARLAVAGLNPHAGEGGAFGDEDISEIQPAVQKARENGIDVTGPIAPDTVFYKAVNGVYDAVVCMYHDQGHIPIKLLDFEGAVNMTLGLPIIRTSVDHGTAYDIAWQGKASLKSFKNACDLAVKLML